MSSQRNIYIYIKYLCVDSSYSWDGSHYTTAWMLNQLFAVLQRKQEQQLHVCGGWQLLYLLLCHRQTMAVCRMQPCNLKYECQCRIKNEQIKSQVAINCLKSNDKSYKNPSEYNGRTHKYNSTHTHTYSYILLACEQKYFSELENSL